MRTLAQVTVVGFSGVVLFKLAGALFFPMFGVLTAVLGLLFKLAMIMVVGYLVLTLFKRMRCGWNQHEDENED